MSVVSLRYDEHGNCHDDNYILDDEVSDDDIDEDYIPVDAEVYKNNIEEGVGVFFGDVTSFIREGNTEMVKLALDFKPSIVEERDTLGETLLMKCANVRDIVDIFDLLLDHGSNIEAKDNRGYTPLCFALRRNDKEYAETLLLCGADVNVSTETIPSLPLYICLSMLNRWGVKMLRKRSVNIASPKDKQYFFLKRSVDICCAELLHEFLELDDYLSHINERDEFGRSLLIRVLQSNHPKEQVNKFFSILLDKKASTKIRDNLGRDAFFVAAQFGYVEVVERFIKMGYKIDSTNYIDEYNSDHPNVIFATIKYCICSFPGLELILMLIDLAPKEILNHLDRDGKTLLQLAVDLKCARIYEKLLSILGNDTNQVEDLSKGTSYILSTSDEPKNIYFWKPGYIYLDNLIRLNKYKLVDQALHSGVVINHNHIFAAVEMFDPTLPDVSGIQYFEDKTYQTLNMLINHCTSKYKLKGIVYFAQQDAIILNKFKATHFLSHCYFSKKKFTTHLNDEESELRTNKMDKFLQETLNIRITLNRSYSNGLHNFTTFHYKFNTKTYKPVEFLYEYLSWKANDYDDDTSRYDAVLEIAISSRRIDIATILLQQGPRVVLDESDEKQIQNYSPEDFEKLYEETKGSGFLTLEQTARIAARSDLKSFHKGWSSFIHRQILQFESRMYAVDLNGESGQRVLYRAASSKNYTPLRYLLDEIDVSASEFVNLLILHNTTLLRNLLIDIGMIYDSFQLSNPLFPAIEEGDCDKLKHIIEEEKLDVNDFYDEIFNALHYAVILEKGNIIKLLKEYGSEELPTKSSPVISYEQLKSRTMFR